MNQRAPGLLFAALCAAALALRLLVPAGWMPAAGPTGFALSLCSGASLPGDPVTPADEGSQPCGFALSLGPLLATAVLLLPLLALALPTALVLRPVHMASRRHRPRPPGQGPPSA